MSAPLPAHHTKSLQTLRYPLRPANIYNPKIHTSSHSLSLTQTSSGSGKVTTGTTLWLSAQVTGLYLVEQFGGGGLGKAKGKGVTSKGLKRRERKGASSEVGAGTGEKKRLRAIELGSGIGLTPLLLASLGMDVLATDVSVVVEGVLRRNVERNSSVVREFCQGHGDGAVTGPGKIEVKVLDWTVENEEWRWDVEGWVTPSKSFASEVHMGMATEGNGGEGNGELGERGLGPPFDLIVTTDTVYHQELTAPLLRTLRGLSKASRSEQSGLSTETYPLIILTLEVRDKDLVDDALRRAREMGFETEKVPEGVVLGMLRGAGMICERNGEDGEEDGEEEEVESEEGKVGRVEDWEGLEIWRLRLKSKVLG